MPRIQCISAGSDSTLVMHYKAYVAKPAHLVSYLITGKNKVEKLDLSILAEKSLVGVEKHTGENYIYYLEKKGKALIIRWIVTEQFQVFKESSGFVTIPGKLLGTEMRANSLQVYSFEKNSYKLTVSRIVKGTLTTAAEYKLPLDLSDVKPSDLVMFSEQSHISAAQAVAKTKVYVGENYISILQDECYDPLAYPDPDKPPPPFYKTSVTRINTATGEKSTFVIPDQRAKAQFCSAASYHYLFRLSLGQEFNKLQVFSLETGKAIHENQIFNAANWKVRNGRKNIVQDASYPMGTPFMLLEPESTPDSFILSRGAYYNETNAPFIMTPSVPLAGILLSVFSAVAGAVAEGPGLSFYHYIKGDFESGFTITAQPPVLRHRIDYYEINMQNQKLAVKGKMYFNLDKSLMAFYLIQDQKKLRMVSFQR